MVATTCTWYRSGLTAGPPTKASKIVPAPLALLRLALPPIGTVEIDHANVGCCPVGRWNRLLHEVSSALPYIAVNTVFVVSYELVRTAPESADVPPLLEIETVGRLAPHFELVMVMKFGAALVLPSASVATTES